MWYLSGAHTLDQKLWTIVCSEQLQVGMEPGPIVVEDDLEANRWLDTLAFDKGAGLLAESASTPLPLHQRVEHLGAAFDLFLASLNAREHEVFARRLGIGGDVETLEEIARTLFVTRERIRQIEAKVLDRLRAKSEILETVEQRLGSLLADREFPLPIEGVEVLDSWMTGFERYGRAIARILRPQGTRVPLDCNY